MRSVCKCPPWLVIHGLLAHRAARTESIFVLDLARGTLSELIPNEAYAGLSAVSLAEHEFIYNFLGSELRTAGVASVIKI